MGERKSELRYALPAMIVAAALFALLLSLTVTQARYVTEIGGDIVDFETQTPFEVGSQQDLYNAIKSGYGYVQIKENLDGPIIMTGDSLELTNNLVIDLNGNEIERNNRESLLNVPSGKSFTVIDSRGGGGMYNPIGSVLTVTGGDLNVYGGIFESGPRPTEYFSVLRGTHEGSALIDVGDTYDITSGGVSETAINRPRLAVRDSGMGNVYFDVAYSAADSELAIDRDTYCYVIVQGKTSDDFATFDTSKATFAYTYYVDADGVPTDDTTGDVSRAIVFGYDKDIESSVEQTDAAGRTIKPAPNYSAVAMKSGTLNVDVSETNANKGRLTGSFYSYFGTQQTSCIYIEGGTMRVSTTGEIKTVDPNALPALASGETRYNSAKYGESACILSVSKTDGNGNPLSNGGSLEIKRLASATSYNGSVISLTGGTITMYDATITKNATLSHGDDPFAVSEESSTGGGTGSEYPADKQYCDAAIFLNGGSLTLHGADSREKTKSVNVIVNKDINNVKARAEGRSVQDYPVSEIGWATGSGSHVPYKTTFGILSRGKSKLKQSSFMAKNLAVTMHGAYSFGIFGTRGTVRVTDGSVTLDSDSHCYGVYAANRTAALDANGGKRAVEVELINTDISVGDLTGSAAYEGVTPDEDMWLDAKGNMLSGYRDGAMRAASCGVYLDSSMFEGGEVTLDNSRVRSRELGVAVYDGTLTFRNGGGIDAYNASAVSLSGGDLIFENNGTAEAPTQYTIDCKLNRAGTVTGTNCEVDTITATNAGKHAYEIYLPYQRTIKDADGNREIYTNENAIRVVGGNLNALGKLKMTFRGLYNDFDQYDTSTGKGSYNNFDRVVIKSFAVACIADSGRANANIDIKYADITSEVGGGVKVQGGAITLGDENTEPEDIKVHTTGYQHTPTAYNACGTETATTWKFFPNVGGGPAVIARSGNITIYNGSFIADSCNGMAASADDGASTSITVHNGTFDGNMKHSVKHTDSSNKEYQIGGPSSFYGMHILGESDIKIYGGTFDGKNGGGIVRGTSKTKRATVKVYEGIFGSTTGQDGFNVYDYSTVFFGAYTEAQLNEKGYTTNTQRKNLIQVSANLFPIAVNSLIPVTKSQFMLDNGQMFANSNGMGANNTSVKVYIFYGKYNINTPSTDRKTLGIGAVNAPMTNVDFFIFGYGKGVYAENRGTWEITRIRWNSTAPDEDYNVHRATTTDAVYCNADENGNPVVPSKPASNLVTTGHVPDVA